MHGGLHSSQLDINELKKINRLVDRRSTSYFESDFAKKQFSNFSF